VLERLGPRLMSLGGAGAAPSRQRTLRAALEWSHSSLSPPEQLALRRLAPFTGGFSAELAEEMLCALGTESAPALAADALDALGALVDKSLVQADAADPPRYRLLESAREFALERLDAAGERELANDRHAQVIAARFAAARDDSDRLTEMAWQTAYVVERDNVHAALVWMCTRDDADTAARLLAFKGLIEQLTGVHEIIPGLPRALEQAERAQPDLRADAMLWTAVVEFVRGDFEACHAYWPRALSHYRQAGHRAGIVHALNLAARSLRRTLGRSAELPAVLAELEALDATGLPPTCASKCNGRAWRSWKTAQR